MISSGIICINHLGLQTLEFILEYAAIRILLVLKI